MSSDSAEPQATKIRWLIVAMLMGFTFLGHFNRVSISVAGTERFIKPGGLDMEQMGLVYSAFLLVYTLSMLPGGWIIDRLGPRWALAGMGLGMGTCVALTGALGWTGIPIAGMLVPLLMIRGIAGGMSVPLHPAAARSVSLWLPLSSRTTANGLVTAGALIGIAVCFPVFGKLMDHFDWPRAFVICGVAMIAYSLAWLALSSDSVIDHPWTNSAERGMVQLADQPAPQTRSTWREFLDLFRNRNLVLLTLSYAALSYFMYLFFYWLGAYFEKTLNLPVEDCRNATMTVHLAMAVGMVIGGIGTDFLGRKVGRRWGCRGIAMLGMSLSALLAWKGLSIADPTQVVWYFAFALGSLGLVEGIFWTAAPQLEPRNGGLAGAFLNTIGNAGGLTAPYLTPVIASNFSWNAAIAVACCSCGIGAILWLWIDIDPNAERISVHAPDVTAPEVVI
ncbi:MFS transporter [Schlesneria sp. T3-172]|uniref:MFS transporter n=1 Tax=Schlesneria sphaerica TaxID=3373610 RepID=UPI0037CB7F8E